MFRYCGGVAHNLIGRYVYGDSMKKFRSLSDLINYLKDNDIKNSLFPQIVDGPSFEWIDKGNGGSAIIPSLNKMNSVYVYRGQSKRFSPCVSSLLRGVVRHEDIFAYKIKLAEFKSILDNPRQQLAKEIGLELNLEALAQHYGLKTTHLDVTHSLSVAAFFACCECADNVWTPVEKGVGVMYRLPFIPGYTCDLVGAQVYPRPKEQMAQSVLVDVNQDFEKMPFVEIYEFEHSYDESEKYFRMFNEGKDLFPFDLLAEKANLVVNDSSLSIETVLRVMEEDDLADEIREDKLNEVKTKLANSGKYSISHRKEYVFSESELEILANTLDEVKESLLADTGFRFVFAK